MKKTILLAFSMLGLSTMLFAQEENKALKITGYAELYYQFDANNPKNNSRPGFVYSHNRNNEVNLNLGFIKANYETEKLRANLAFGTGTYMNANYAAEPDVLKNIYEANVGVKISKSKNLWIAAGILPSHIGFESAVSKDCWTLTRSILAENSPYYESGAKISYTSDNGKWFVSGLVLNGWQRIQRVDGNSTVAFGHQLTFKPMEKITLNSSSFIGNDKPDSIKQMRYFHNLYGIFQLSDKLALTTGFDIAAEQKMKGSEQYNVWYSPVIIAKYKVTEKLSFAARGEYYSDKKGVIIATETDNGFQTFGYSLNADYWILPNLVWRTEIKNLNSKDQIFLNRNDVFQNNNFSAVTSLAISF
ncbi:porin [Epilithonimonas xixisoli]|uniref:Putative OmpL-like beta-barrel porin-2 n=1 Tax=Epilithonimonas xixisoli TaxID=1476462 RepID=A0A4R8I979_9FLAO|nr:porin [Epilithonimonas xixisoli]TDX86642.1 putative OmpL-like beta-barrel porin-2 [Epilithonimonas xixisoli]